MKSVGEKIRDQEDNLKKFILDLVVGRTGRSVEEALDEALEDDTPEHPGVAGRTPPRTRDDNDGWI